ncbi:hypothetical protein V2A60_000051 [Cordyceps javanica]
MAGGTRRQTVATGNGVLFEVVFRNSNPQKKPGHGISLSYGGQPRFYTPEAFAIDLLEEKPAKTDSAIQYPLAQAVTEEAEEKSNSLPFAPIPYAFNIGAIFQSVAKAIR